LACSRKWFATATASKGILVLAYRRKRTTIVNEFEQLFNPMPPPR
jgi:hypothetical protein